MEQSMLTALLRAVVTGEETAAVNGADWERLLRLARAHRVEPLVYDAARDLRGVPAQVKKCLERAYQLALYRSLQQDYTADAIRASLSAAKVPHILLRGAVLKHDYPAPALRTMSDLDYLVRVEDYPVIRRSMESLGGRHIHTDGGHFSFTLPPSVAVEFHPDLIYTASPVGTAINPGWQYVRPGSGPYDLALTEEGFYLNLICHLAYHFAKGGTGVRSVLDVWVCRYRHTPQPDRTFVEQELERAGLRVFGAQMEALAEAWFGQGTMTPELEELANDILASGAYGTTDRAVLNAACFSSGVSGWSALREKAVYPRGEMENRFPWVRGRPYLLPAAWCVRAVRAVTRHHRQIARWGRTARALSADALKEQRDKLRRFGLLS